MNLKISEIFFSLQGEAGTNGLPTIFVRTAGCNLRCLYCDTDYAREDGEEFPVDEIIKKIADFPCKRVCITGGEPLSQREAVLRLAQTLLQKKYSVTMETNGSYPVTGLSEGLRTIIDVKTPGSGMSGVTNYENLRSARHHHDEFKFVISKKEDFSWSMELIERHRLDRRYLCHISPAGTIAADWLADKILESGRDVRLNLQLHKIIWPDGSRGG